MGGPFQAWPFFVLEYFQPQTLTILSRLMMRGVFSILRMRGVA